MSRGAGRAILLAVLALGAVRTGAAAAPAFTRRLVERTHSELAAILAARPKRPAPIAVTWRAAKQGALELGAPLLATAATDADGDGTDELYAVTSEEVLAIALPAGKPAIVERAPFAPSMPAASPPRDPVGTAYVEGGVVVAAASPWAAGLRLDRRGGTSAVARGELPFGVCRGERLTLVPGRNYFGDAATGFVAAVRCRDDLVNADGQPIRVRAQLGVNHRLTVVVDTQCGTGACAAPQTFEYGGVGFAFAIADVNRNGTPEVVVSGAGAPGDADAVKVIELGGDEKKGLFRKAFTGGVAGVEVIERGPGRAPQVLAAVRLPGSTRVDVWSLN